MRAGLLADIILGESPHLKGLVRHFNMLVLDTNGRITGFNNHFLRNARKSELDLLNQHFVKVFDSDDGKADMHQTIKQALKGQPGAVNFYLFESKVSFKGVLLPVYDRGHTPTSLIIISKEEHRIQVSDEELEDFWKLAAEMIAEVGVSPENNWQNDTKTESQKLSLSFVEDSKGLINKVFKKKTKSKKFNISTFASGEEALQAAEETRPDVVVTNYCPKGSLDMDSLVAAFRNTYHASVIFVSQEEAEIRIEDGWLDIHVKADDNAMEKILELISQLYR